ncbi:MAG: Gldg family protein [Thermodesulfobacteriota bacterium]
MKIKGIFLNRSTRYGTHMIITVLIVLGILILIGAISVRHHFRFDLTKTKRHSLSDETIKVLSSINKEVNAIAFYQENSGSEGELKDFFKLYKYKNQKFNYRFIDPDRNPTLAKKYGITDYGTTVFESGKNETRVSWGREEQITNAILKVIREGKKAVYFLKGHGENDIAIFAKEGYSQAKKALEGQNYEVKELTLLRADSIPEDASVLIISGPKKELMESEMKLIKGYIEKGGNLLFLIDPFTVPGLAALLEGYNIKLREDIIIDTMSQLFGGDYLIPIIGQYEPHSITRNFNINTFFPFARSIEIIKQAKAGIAVEPLANTNKESWGEINRKMLDKEGKAKFDSGHDTHGPLTIAAVVTIQTGEKKNGKKEGENSKMAVFGDSDFANNSYFNILGNKDLFLNTINWLAEEEDLISIRPKDTDYNPVILSRAMGKVIFFIPVVIIPAMILVSGIVVLSVKRWKK